MSENSGSLAARRFTRPTHVPQPANVPQSEKKSHPMGEAEAIFFAALALASQSKPQTSLGFESAFAGALASHGEKRDKNGTVRFASSAERIVNRAKQAGLVDGPIIPEGGTLN